MVDEERAKDLNEAATRFAETLADSYRIVYGQASESADRQQQRARDFSELVTRNLREQSESGRETAQQLSEQASKRQEAGQSLARESVEAYTEFLNDAFSRYRAGTEWFGQRAQEGVRTLSDTTAGLLGAATGAAEATIFPIEGYDEMNVEEISKRLNDLSLEELQLVRDYEELNKRRETLLEQMDQKIRAA